jgi:hypothetical protein
VISGRESHPQNAIPARPDRRTFHGKFLVGTRLFGHSQCRPPRVISLGAVIRTMTVRSKMRLTPKDLERVNLAFDEFPDDFDRSRFRRDVTEFAHRLSTEFGAQFEPNFSNQDCTFGAELWFPPSLSSSDEGSLPGIRVSNHQRLFVILVVRQLREGIEDRVEQVAQSLGFRYTPEPIFGLPFDRRDRMNGDLFNRLYDYT